MAAKEDLSGIRRDPAVRGSRNCIAGRRIQRLQILTKGGRWPKKIWQPSPTTTASPWKRYTLERAYYRRHREAIDAEIREDTELEVMAEELGIDEAVDWLLRSTKTCRTRQRPELRTARH